MKPASGDEATIGLTRVNRNRDTSEARRAPDVYISRSVGVARCFLGVKRSEAANCTERPFHIVVSKAALARQGHAHLLPREIEAA